VKYLTVPFRLRRNETPKRSNGRKLIGLVTSHNQQELMIYYQFRTVDYWMVVLINFEIEVTTHKAVGEMRSLTAKWKSSGQRSTYVLELAQNGVSTVRVTVWQYVRCTLLACDFQLLFPVQLYGYSCKFSNGSEPLVWDLKVEIKFNPALW
jgi:hypothetical protein